MWQSYLENKTSGAMRMYWVYGPDHKDITISKLRHLFSFVKNLLEKFFVLEVYAENYFWNLIQKLLRNGTKLFKIPYLLSWISA